MVPALVGAGHQAIVIEPLGVGETAFGPSSGMTPPALQLIDLAVHRARARQERRIVLGRPERLGPIGDANINVDMIIQNVSQSGYTDLTFTVPKGDLWQAMKIVKATAKAIGAKGVVGDDDVAKVSVVGVGMRSHSGVATTMFRALAQEGINIQMISTSEIKISVVIDEKYLELAVRVLHKAFELDQAR